MEDDMLTSSKMIGFALTKDSKRSRKFYEETLGFKFMGEDQFALVMKTDENMIRISPVKDFTPAQHTILGWEVKQIERVAVHLKELGVLFERYPWAKQDDLGIWTAPSGDKVGWFKDPDGNLLSISQHQ
jgi:catechol 2,3-dioxygenase-like lactoylglutathione lyase family enzyme